MIVTLATRFCGWSDKPKKVVPSLIIFVNICSPVCFLRNKVIEKSSTSSLRRWLVYESQSEIKYVTQPKQDSSFLLSIVGD